jgi:hypothetical protein
MDKSDRDHARQLLEMANKDHSALSHMLGSDDINRDEAIEKTRTFPAQVKEILDSPT